MSSGFGPVTAFSSMRNRRSPSTASPSRAKESLPPSRVDTLVAGIELASGVAALIGYAQDRRQAKLAAADSVRAAEILTSLHLEDFPAPTQPMPPEAPLVPRRWQRMWHVAESDRVGAEVAHAEAEAIYAEDTYRWNLLNAHDSHEVIATVDDALADNASRSACVDAGTGPLGNYVTLVVHYPGQEIVNGIVQSGASTRPRTEKEQTDLYRRALASTVIASAKEALSCAPAATEAYVIVLRYDIQGRRKNRHLGLDAIYAGAIGRRVLSIDWTVNTPLDLVLSAREACFNQDRKGRFQPLGDSASEDLRRLVDTVAATTTATKGEPPRHRFSRNESWELMQIQESEPFMATCACPGCGTEHAHALRSPRTDEPDWADAIRTCATCNREWAQA